MKHKGYIIIAKWRDTGKLSGCCVNDSGILHIDNKHVKVYSESDRYSYHGDRKIKMIRVYIKNFERDYGDRMTFKLFAIGRKTCPLKIDWSGRIELKRNLRERTRPYEYAWLPYTLK